MNVTPGRETRLVLGLTETTIKHRAHEENFSAEQIGAVLPYGAPGSANVWYLPGGAWGLRPYAADTSRLLHPDVAPSIIGANDVNKVASMSTLLTTPQISGFGGGALGSVSHWQKEIADPSSPADELTGDAAAFPKTPDTYHVALGTDPSGIFANQASRDRVLAGLRTYGPNQAFAISLMAPTGHWPVDQFFTFYLGGQCPVRPGTLRGGEFALALYGTGEAVLWERDLLETGGWGSRKLFRWAEPGRAEQNTHVLFLVPYGRNRIALFNRASTSVIPSALPFTFAPSPVPPFSIPLGSASDYYEEQPYHSGHEHLSSMTGAGPVRLDIRRDYQDVFMLARLDYPPAGRLIGSTFALNRVPDDGEVVYVAPNVYYNPGVTQINFTAFTADTHEPCVTVVNGFLTKAGHSKYYFVIDFLTADVAQTPILYSYAIKMDAVWQTVSVEEQTGGQILGVMVQQGEAGRDLAVLEVEDTDKDLRYIQERDGVAARIVVMDTRGETPVVRSVLFDGRTANVHVHDVQGAGAFQWPTADWRSYPNVRIVGRWADVARRRISKFTDYGKDPLTGGRLPWTDTAVIRDLLLQGGVPASQMDVPEIPLRLPASQDNKVEFFGNAAAEPTNLIDFIVRDLLTARLVRCANSGPVGSVGPYGPPGMWRLLPPINPEKVRATFWRHTPPYVIGRDLVDEASYLINETWMATYAAWFEAPENTSITIQGQDGTRRFVNAPLQNKNFNNPHSPDYSPLGELPYVQEPSQAYPNQYAVDWAARIEYYRRCKGRQYAEFIAPLLLIFDADDPWLRLERPLRERDVVNIGTVELVGGTPTPVLKRAVVETCVPRYHRDEGGDSCQMASYLVRYLLVDDNDFPACDRF